MYTIILWVLFFTIHTFRVLLAVFLREAVNEFVKDRVEYENVLNGCLKFVCGFFTLFHHFESILGGIKTRLTNISALQAAAEEFLSNRFTYVHYIFHYWYVLYEEGKEWLLRG